MSQKTDYTAWHQSQPDEGLDKAVEKIERRGKAILVMDMPESCRDNCPCEYDYLECRAADRRLDITTADKCRPDWCPLVPAIGYVQPVGNMVSWEDEDERTK